MRDINRIKKFMSEFVCYWEKYAPDLRFGQLVMNFQSYVQQVLRKDFFYIEDDEMAKLMSDYFAAIHTLTIQNT